MTEMMQVWKCNICGNIVEILHKGEGSLVCCNQPMILMEENIVDAVLEKHIPVIDGKQVRVGSVSHPMESGHYIEWIEGEGKDGEISKVFLKVGDEAVVEFYFEVVRARAYCNLHGLWKSE